MKICPDCEVNKPFEEYHRDISKKDACSTYCRMCAKIRSRKDYLTHRTKRLAQQREYNKSHGEIRLRAYRRYAEQNGEKLAAYQKNYRIENKERTKQKLSQSINERIKYLHSARRSDAKKKSINFNLTVEMLHVLFLIQRGRCAITNIEFDMKFSDDYRSAPFSPSIDKKDARKGYTIDNVQFVCFMVNMGKNEYPQELFDQMCLARAKVLIDAQV